MATFDVIEDLLAERKRVLLVFTGQSDMWTALKHSDVHMKHFMEVWSQKTKGRFIRFSTWDRDGIRCAFLYDGKTTAELSWCEKGNCYLDLNQDTWTFGDAFTLADAFCDAMRFFNGHGIKEYEYHMAKLNKDLQPDTKRAHPTTQEKSYEMHALDRFDWQLTTENF